MASAIFPVVPVMGIRRGSARWVEAGKVLGRSEAERNVPCYLITGTFVRTLNNRGFPAF